MSETATDLPRAILLDRAKKQQPTPHAEVILRAVQGARIKRQIDELQEQLKAINQAIAAGIGPGHTLLLDELATIPVSQTLKLSLADEAKLRKVLGERFQSLVDTTYTIPDRHVADVRRRLGRHFDLIQADHELTPKLKGFATDADNPERDAIAACLTFEPQGVVVKYLAPKKLPATA
jgi:hypothetical protein